MTLRRIISTSLVFALGFAPASAFAGGLTDLGKVVVSKAVNKGVNVAWDADTKVRQVAKDPNSLSGAVLRKTANLGQAVAGQVRQQVNTPQQTPITKILGAGKKVAGVVVNNGQPQFQFPNGNTGIVGPKIIKIPGTNLPLDQIINVGNGGGIVIDPGIGNGQGGGNNNGNNGNNGIDPILGQILGNVISNVIQGAAGNIQCPAPGNGNGNGGNGGNGNGNNNGGGVIQPVAQIDLQLHDVKLVDLGDDTMGPAYRLTLRNNSNRSATSPFVALVMASQDAQPTDQSPYATAEVPNLAAGQMTTVDIRLPQVVHAQPEVFGFLTAAVGTPAGLTEIDGSNNVAAFQRSAVMEIPAKVMAVKVDETAGRMILEGEGFGSKFGQVFLTVGGQKFPAKVTHWGPAAVYFTIDDFTATNATTGSFTLVRNDGRLAPPLDVALAN